MRQHTPACAAVRACLPRPRQHTSAYVSIRQHTSQHTPAYASIRQHTRQFALACRVLVLLLILGIEIARFRLLLQPLEQIQRVLDFRYVVERARVWHLLCVCVCMYIDR
jgi:hypothetical protein